MYSPRSSSGASLSATEKPETPPVAPLNRSSWIYTPTTVPSTQKASNATPILHTRASSHLGVKDTQVTVAAEILSKVDFVEAVLLICERKQISPEEAMRLLYNNFYAQGEGPSEKGQTWSQQRQQRPNTVDSVPKPVPSELSLPKQGRSPDTIWNHSSVIDKSDLLSKAAQGEAAHLNLKNHHQRLPFSPSAPTFPSQQMESITRPIRGSTFSNAYKANGTALDQSFGSRLNISGAHGGDKSHSQSYNPTVSAFRPTSPQAMARGFNSSSLSYATPTTFNKLNPYMPQTAAGQNREWFGNGLQYKSKSPPGAEATDYDDSGLDLTQPFTEEELSLPGLPVPPKLNQGGTDQKRFIPMNAALKSTVYQPTASLLFKPPVSPPAQFSERYLGQHTDVNASANIPDEYNCAIWIRNLPPNITYTELLGSIKGVGRIWCSYINPPDYEKHHTAAAKVVFYRPESARAFLQFVWTQNPEIRGYFVKADLNRIKSAPHSLNDGTSRVLIVTGEDWFANEEYLIEWFGQQCQFQLDQVVTHLKMRGRAVVEFRFGSYRSQAEAGFKALTINRPKGFEKVDFGDDPCEVGDSAQVAARSVALQRIQGVGF